MIESQGMQSASGTGPGGGVAKRQSLTFLDIVVLALIFFGEATWSSLQLYLQMVDAGQVVPDNLTLNEIVDSQVVRAELLSLALAWLYLKWRRFDWGVLDFSVGWRTLPLALLMVVCAGLTADIYQITHAWFLPEHYPVEEARVAATHYTPLIILAAFLNGFYEELFFMGLVFAAAPGIRTRAVVFSLFVRFIFHTYQGLPGAFTVTTLGLVFLLFRRKVSTLVPFMLAHAVFDIFGLSLLGIFFGQDEL